MKLNNSGKSQTNKQNIINKQTNENKQRKTIKLGK